MISVFTRLTAMVVAFAVTTISLYAASSGTSTLAPPVNDECLMATQLVVNGPGACTSVASGTLSEATPSTTVAACLGTANNDVWYRFSATATTLEITLPRVQGGDSDFVHIVYSGACGTLTEIGCFDPNSSSLSGLTIGDTYFIRVYTFESAAVTTTFDICVKQPSPAPANDECSSAFPLTLSADETCTAGFNGTTFGATRSTESNLCSTANDDDVWFNFTAPESGPYLFSLTNTTALTYVHIYQGACGGSLTRVNACLTPSRTQQDLVAGQIYRVQIHTASTTVRTNFRLCVRQVAPPPINDNCADAVSVFVTDNDDCANTVFGDLEGATSSGNNNACTGTENDDVWFSFIANSEAVDISLLNIRGNVRDVVHSVYTGVCGNLTQLSCVDDPNNSTLSGLSIGRQYFIRVNTWGNVDGANTTFDLCLSRATAGTLPVEFIDFTAWEAGKTNQLSWSTASEANTFRHLIERSISGSRAWSVTGEIAAVGESERPSYYTFTDRTPPQEVAHYRIRSVDYDGFESVSKVIRIERTTEQAGIISVSPNPALDRLSVTYVTESASTVTLSIYNMLGRRLLDRQLVGAPGLQQTEISLAGFPAGVYLVEINDGKSRSTRKILRR